MSNPRLARVRQIVEASSRGVWGAFGAHARRSGEVPDPDAIQDMVAQPAADALLDLHERSLSKKAKYTT